MDLKRRAAAAAIGLVAGGTVVGLGTGSTAAWAIRLLGERMKREGLEVVGIPTSAASEKLAEECGIPLTTLDEHPEVDLTFDGADEVDPALDLVKGLGGALVREKLVAVASAEEVIMVDGSKMVPRLCARAPLPVEVLPFGWKSTAKRLSRVGCAPELRAEGGRPFVSDNGNYILHCRFPTGIGNGAAVEREIKSLPGVVESGLFIGLATKVIVASVEGVRVLARARPARL